MAGFNKGILGSPWSRETYGPSGADPGDAESEDGPRIGPGRFAKRVTMEFQTNGRNGSNGSNGKKSDD